MATSAKRIAKNTLFMYLRLLITVPLALYTSRVLLQQLGVTDFGIYNAVGGVVALFATLRGAFSSSTQRFYNYALADNDNHLLSQMFSTSLVIHFGICAALILLIEAFGLWFIPNKMVFPPEQIGDVYFVFQMTVLTLVFIVMNIPFDGMVIAQERMGFYAYVTIWDAVAKLALVFLLIFVDTNKLRLYAVFQLCVSASTFLITLIYNRVRFQQVKFIGFHFKIFKDMASFASWGLMGNICYSLVNEGVNLLLNIFGGVVANAARGICYQVRNTLNSVVSNTFMASRPQGTQMYARKDFDNFFRLIHLGTKVLFGVASLMVFPLFFYTHDVLMLWLGEVPQYTVVFLQLSLFFLLVRTFHSPLDLVFQSSGRMKQYQITTVSISSLTFFLSWWLLSWGFRVYVVFVLQLVVEMVLTLALVLTAKKDGLNPLRYLLEVIKPCALMFAACFIFGETSQWLHLHFVLGIAYLLIGTACLVVFVGFSHSERKMICAKFFKRG